MFYKETDVIAELTCTLCSKIYTDPRCLPCGHTVCHKCIVVSAETDFDMYFTCSMCQQVHSVPEGTGFPPVLSLVSLLKLRAENVSRPQNVDKLKLSLVELNEKRTACKLVMASPVRAA